MSLVAATASNGPLGGSRGWELQELGQRCGSGVMHGGTHRHLDGFQIQTASLAATMEDDAQQLVYFARHFLADRFGRFFSWADSAGPSTGRNRQISSLTSRSWPPSSRKRWYSATSR